MPNQDSSTEESKEQAQVHNVAFGAMKSLFAEYCFSELRMRQTH